MNEAIIIEIDEAGNALLQTISKFTQEQFNKVPFEGSWTAGQVTEHVFKSVSGIPKVWTGSTKITDRKPDEKAGNIQSIFLDFSSKMKSPEFILPSDDPKDKQNLVSTLTGTLNEIKTLAGDSDLTLTCTSFLFPQSEELTRLEWATFMVCHTKRHTHQLQNIYSKLEEQLA